MKEHAFSTRVASRLAQIGVTVFERGWLSSNNVFVQGEGSTALVDSGYCTHAGQTVALVQASLQQRPLDLLLNTHLHSDHCGGNAALQSAFPKLTTLIPPGQATAVEDWDPVALTHEPTGQICPVFKAQGLLIPGQTIRLGDTDWEIHAAKGHDPHSIVLFEPFNRVLISADALWENGFGVVFPELEGLDAFDEVANTLLLISELGPLTVIPGHGAVFENVEAAVQRAYSRLDQFVNNPEKHRRYALKVLVKFKLLEWKTVTRQDLLHWYENTPYIASIEKRKLTSEVQNRNQFFDSLIADLAKSGALRVEGNRIIDM